MKVTDIAKRAGIGAHTVRYYVRAGLLEPRRDPVNNYKQFREEHVARLRFIKGAQALGFSLSEVLGLLHYMDRGECPCSAMQEQLAGKIVEARARMDALAQRLAFMQRVHAGWGAETKGNRDLGSLCRFLEEQAARGQLPADPMAPLAARGARGGTRTRSDESRRRSGAAVASKSLASKSVAAASLRFLQSGWNSPSTR